MSIDQFREHCALNDTVPCLANFLKVEKRDVEWAIDAQCKLMRELGEYTTYLLCLLRMHHDDVTGIRNGQYEEVKTFVCIEYIEAYEGLSYETDPRK